jgi:hypothetical protein
VAGAVVRGAGPGVGLRVGADNLPVATGAAQPGLDGVGLCGGRREKGTSGDRKSPCAEGRRDGTGTAPSARRFL